MTNEYSIQVAAGKKNKECNVLVEAIAPSAESAAVSRFAVAVDGKQLEVEARRFDERGNVATWSLMFPDGRQVLVDVDGALPDLRLSVGGGETMTLKVNDRRDLLAAATPQGAASSGDVRAAMPGKVVKLLCQVGDAVKAGQGLIIVEAMKMENEVRAPAGGKVTAVAVRDGQTVESGQILVTLAAE
jgi:pyruvate carboxylase subunit B